MAMNDLGFAHDSLMVSISDQRSTDHFYYRLAFPNSLLPTEVKTMNFSHMDNNKSY